MAATQSQILDALLNYRLGYIGDRWNFFLAVGSTEAAPGGIGQGLALTFSFPTTLPSYDAGLPGFAALTAEQAQAARQVFAYYASLTQLTFTETSQLGTKNVAIIQHTITTPGVAGYANSPGLGYGVNGFGTIVSVNEERPQAPGDFSKGDVYIDAGYATGDYAPGGQGYLLLLHEIGHSMGMLHPFEGSAPLGASENHKGFTVMAYNEAPHSLTVGVTGTQFSYSLSFENVQPRSLMLGDILALQHTYGTNTATNNGNTTYQWQTGEKFLETIWDGGGTDTIDASNQVLRTIINLAPGSFSSIGLRQTHAELFAGIPAFAEGTVTDTLVANGLTEADLYSGRDNLAIAFGANIENATGGSGADTLTGNALANVLNGGAGFDTLDGGDGDDRLNGANNADQVFGGAGNDSLFGGKSADLLDGGDGDDVLFGQVGNDSLYGGNGTDTIDYAAGDAVTVNLALLVGGSTVSVVGVFNGTDILLSIENVIGSAFADSLTGDLGVNVLTGGAGNDSLFASDGADTIDGGNGDDLIAGGAGGDSIVGGIGNDNIGGGKGGDRIFGDDGNDTVNGNLGNDQLSGGAGADKFIFNAVLSAPTNVDTILDFEAGVDQIQLSASIFMAFNAQVGQVVGLSDKLLYDSNSGVLRYDADGAVGAAATDFAIIGLGTHPMAMGNDFLIVA